MRIDLQRAARPQRERIEVEVERGGQPRRRAFRSRTRACRCWTDGRPPGTSRKSLLSAASHGRLPFGFVTINGASMPTTQSSATNGLIAARMLASSVCAETATRPPVVVDHGDARRLAFSPREIEPNEVHTATVPYSGPTRRRKLCVCDDPECAGQPVCQRRDGGHLVAGGQDRRRAPAVAGGAAGAGGVGCRGSRRRDRRLRAGDRRRRPGLDRRA